MHKLPAILKKLKQIQPFSLAPFYTGWPRKNATTLIVNFKNIINKTELIFVSLCVKFIFQQNDTMIINFG